MTNKKCYISNSTSPKDNNLAGQLLMTWELHSKHHTTLSKKLFTFINFFLPQNCTFNFTSITLVRKRMEITNIKISNFYVILHEVHDSIQ